MKITHQIKLVHVCLYISVVCVCRVCVHAYMHVCLNKTESYLGVYLIFLPTLEQILKGGLKIL